MRSMDHCNAVSLKHCFFSTTSRDELFLNLVMEFVPESLHRVLKHYSNMNQRMPLIYVKLYTYQVRSHLYSFGNFCYCLLLNLQQIGCDFIFFLGPFMQIFRGLAYIHTVPGVCHRDVKPQNLLVCPYFIIWCHNILVHSQSESDSQFIHYRLIH